MIKGFARKRIYHGCLVQIIRHSGSLFGITRILLSVPRIRERFCYFVMMKWEHNNSAHVSCFFHHGAYRLSDYNSVTVTVGHYEPVPPRVGNTISYLLAVDRSHVSEIHEGKIGNGTSPATLISSVSQLYLAYTRCPYSPRGDERLNTIQAVACRT